MTLKETIAREFLDAMENSDGLDGVFQRHNRSKGPLYAGLAEATSQLRHRLERVQHETVESVAERDQLRNEVKALEGQRKELDSKVQTLYQQSNDTETRLAEVQEMVDGAAKLARCGFGEVELSRLFDILGQMAASQGEPPEVGISQFFETIERYEKVVSFEMEAKRAEARAERAKAEAEHWEADAKRSETQSKARKATISLVEKLLGEGVKAKDLPQWEKVLAKAGITAENMADALEQYSSLEALVRARQMEAGELEQKVAGLGSQVTALTQERDDVHAAIQAVRDTALRQVKQAGRQIVREVRETGEQAKGYVDALAELGTEYGRLKEEAASLQGAVDLACLLTGDVETWGSAPQEFIGNLLMRVVQWTQVDGHDALIPVPDAISHSSLISPHAQLKLSAVLLWALSGVVTGEERRALANVQ